MPIGNCNIFISVVIILLHMWKNYNKYKVMEVFFDNPLPEGLGFQLREISRKVNIAPKSVSIYLNELVDDGLIVKKPHRVHGYPLYHANADSDAFRLYKKLDMIRSISDCGLLDYLSSDFMPDCIVLFGSASRGEDTDKSDIDIFMKCSKRKADLRKYEKELNRKISLFFSASFKELSSELKNNIINGVLLKGYLKVF